jgi:hypothetical protein
VVIYALEMKANEPSFMASKVDDVRLPFSVLDPIIGDVFSVLWEPEMMSEMGNALKILTTEVITTVGQQVLAATVMTALLSALQWPLSEFAIDHRLTTSPHQTGVPYR